ncbi:hypothetical protein [Mesorhizobium sp.]|nr:hypothetical protein [Mesorhizobium sp.]
MAETFSPDWQARRLLRPFSNDLRRKRYPARTIKEEASGSNRV